MPSQGFDLPQSDAARWKPRLAAAEQRIRSNAGSGSWPTLILGLVEQESGESAAGEETLKSVILLPDRNLAHHYSRLMRNIRP